MPDAGKEMELLFEEGILTLDVQQVQMALDAGVSPDHKVMNGRAFDWFLVNPRESLYDTLEEGGFSEERLEGFPETDAEFDRRVYQMTVLLLSRGYTLFEKDKSIHAKSFLVDKYVPLMALDAEDEGINREAFIEIALYTLLRSLEDEQIVGYRLLNESVRKSLLTPGKKFEIDNPSDVKKFEGFVRLYMAGAENMFESIKSRLEEEQNPDLLLALREIDRDLVDVSEILKKQYSGKLQYFEGEELRGYSYEDIIRLGYAEYFVDKPYKIRHWEKALGGAAVATPLPEGTREPSIGDDISLSRLKKVRVKVKGARGNEEECEMYELPDESPEDVLKDLETFIGLEDEKEAFLKWALMVDKVHPEDPKEMHSFNSAYLGPPGVAKTALSRLKARFLHAKGLLKGNLYREGSPRDIIAGFVGQTGEKTANFLNSADVIFLDEIYGLHENSKGRDISYSKKAVTELVAYLENNRHKPVLFAGYDGDMQKLFEMNKGFKSRVKDIRTIEGYDMEMLGKIFDAGLKERQYKGITSEARTRLLKDLEYYKDKMGEEFANGREIRNILEQLKEETKYRLYVKGSEGTSVSERFNKVSNRPVVPRREIEIVLEDIEAINLRKQADDFVNEKANKKVVIGGVRWDEEDNEGDAPQKQAVGGPKV